MTVTTIPPDVKAVLLKVRDEVLTSPDRWTQGAYGRDPAGRAVSHGSRPSCCRWCLVGAIQMADGDDYSATYYRAIDFVWIALDYETIEWNDESGRTFQDVRDLMDRLIALPEAQS